MTKKPVIIAIDGNAASGKGTLARRLAEYFNMAYLDTGRIYRLTAWAADKNGININKLKSHDDEEIEKLTKVAANLDISQIAKIDLSSEKIGMMASVIAAIPEIRNALLELQRNVAKDPRGAVLDGRDIGTVVCPDANIKLFITADLETRAERRYKELKTSGKEVIYASILRDIKERDERDRVRAVAPLVPAKDAIHIDTSDMNMDEVFDKALLIILAATSGE